MPRPNAGGGRYNQSNNDPTVPRRALFSTFASGKGKGGDKGKGGSKGGKDKDGKGKRPPVFESQKERDKWKGAQKGSPAGSASVAKSGSASATTSAAMKVGLDPRDGGSSAAALWRRTDAPSYVHGIFCMTRDDHIMLEPLLTPCGDATSSRRGAEEEGEVVVLPVEVAEEADEHLRGLGFPPRQIQTALQAIGKQLVQECEDHEVPVTSRRVAERSLEWLCCVTAEDSLPSKLREPREVATARRRQEERNVAFQTRALLLGGGLDSTHVTRIEKLGFSRARAIEALAKAPGNELLPAVKALLADYLPLEVEEGAGEAEAPSSYEELEAEAEALKGAYGEEAVHTFAHVGNFEVDIGIPGTEWRLAVMIPEMLPYPGCAPLLCPKHPRLREAGRPRLLAALGEVCRGILGAPMLFTLCEWLEGEGERFLVPEPSANASREAQEPRFQQATSVQRQYKALEASEQRQREEAEELRVRAARVEQLRELEAREQQPQADLKLRDKIAIDIRQDPESGGEYDLSGYDDARVAELVREAFSTPLVSPKTVCISFIIGGGKAIRGKYAESLQRSLPAALQELGFEKDSSSSAAAAESSGTFKLQHNTQRNLKFVQVFPRVVKPEASGEAPAHETLEAARERLVRASHADFVREVQPWTRSKEGRPRAERLLQYLRELVQELEPIERKLGAGQPVSERERRLYDEVAGHEEVSQRVQWLNASLWLNAGQPSRPGASRGEGSEEGPDGATLEIEAPTDLEKAATRMGDAGAAFAPPAEATESDLVLLKQRIAQTKAESQRLASDMRAPKSLAEVRQALPAAAKRSEIQEALRSNQVLVVEGDTGCGKSTQVPQFILEDWIQRGEGAAVNLLMTQPRRISAIGVAERIASEMDSRVGDVCGYSIRLESRKSHRTKILVCTTGVVLRRLESDRDLRGVTHIVVDECHERDLDTDFLLTVLKDLLPKRPALKVVLMSATINAQVFRDYFQGCLSINIPGRTYPVTTYYLEHALDHTKFVVEPNSEYSLRDANELGPQEASELQQLCEKEEYQALLGGSVSRRVLEQMHRMDPEKINFDLVAAVVRHIHRNVDPPNGKKKVLGAILVFVPGFGEIKRCIRAIEEEASNLWVLPLHSMISVVDQRKVFQRPPSGQRKVVVTTNIAETSITIDDVEYVVDCGRHKQTKYDPQNRVSMLVDCVETKANGKQRRGRAGRVKPGVCYHLLNVRKWRRLEDYEKPEMLRVPLDSLCLRISLLGLGHPHKFLMKALSPPTEAAVRSSLQQLVELSAVEMLQRQGDPEQQPGSEGTWDKEEQERLLKAKLRLTPLGTQLAQLPVDAGVGKLLVLGSLFGIPREVCVLAAALSTKSPFLAAVGDKKKEVDKRRLELSAGLESDHLLLVSLFERWEQLGGKTGTARSWCRSNNLDVQTFEAVAEMRTHLLGVLFEQGFLPRADEGSSLPATGGGRWNRRGSTEQPEQDLTSRMPSCLSSIITAGEEFERRKQQLLRALLCAALWPNVSLRKADEQLFARNQSGLAFHPGSILALQDAENAEAQAGDWHCPECGFFNFGIRTECLSCGTPKPPPGNKRKVRPIRHRAFMYNEKSRTVGNPSTGAKGQTYIRECSGVPLKALFLWGHRVAADFLSGRASVDGWIHCQAAPRDTAMLLGLRRRLQQVLSRSLGRAATATAGQDDAQVAEDREVINVVAGILVLDVE